MNIFNTARTQRLIAKRYEEQGYVVTLDPPSSEFPFSLGSYRPDILAKKGDEKIIVDVKMAGTRGDAEAYLRLDQEIQRHPGWRFLFVSVTEEELQEQISSITGSPDLKRIQEQLAKIDKLAEKEELAGMLLPQLWTVYLSALRLLALYDGLPTEQYSDLSFLNQAYSTGLLSFDEYESARRLMKIRNRAVYSLDSPETPTDWELLREMVDTVLERISDYPVPTEWSA